MIKNNNFDWLKRRSVGLLLPISCLPSNQGIGCLGSPSAQWLEFLKNLGMHYWQICPIGPTGYGDSPYQCFSSFAGNPYFINLENLVEENLLNSQDFVHFQKLEPHRVDYGFLFQHFWFLLEKAYKNFIKAKNNFRQKAFKQFYIEEKDWLEKFAYFFALKKYFNWVSWNQWPKSYQNVHQAFNSPLRKELSLAIEMQMFVQYLFFDQWKQLQQKAKQTKISIVGDLPFYVGLDSADVWSNPELFDLDKNLQPLNVAGVPPDYFSSTGQLWGNPLYLWERHKATNYAWWFCRIQHCTRLFDILRIDHFRAFYDFWSIPARSKEASLGQWKLGPGLVFFQELKQRLPNLKLLVEDLGDLSPGVKKLQKTLACPGMAILQFAFGGKSDNPYLPHNLEANTVLYTGSHDNDTSLGWYSSVDESTRDHFRRYLRVDGTHASWDLIRAAYASKANLVLLPIQDLLSLDSEARLNHPSKAQGNWQWRVTIAQLQQLEHESSYYLQELKQLYGR